jgi:uncharacterized protein YndB with AHSA1/START domain
MQFTQVPVAVTGMLIRRPVADVFAAFIDPAITTRFWFTKGSGRVEPGKHLQWEWEMYGASTQVDVKEVDRDQRILMEWVSYGGVTTTVEWLFAARAQNETFVTVTERGFRGDGDAIIKSALDSTGGFTLVLAGAKAWLEHGITLNLIADRSPGGHGAG